MNFPNEVSCSILIDPRDLGNVIGGKNSIDPRDLTVLPDGFHPSATDSSRHAGEGPRDERLVCRDLDGFADAGELAEENARLYGAPSVADLAETVWGCTSLEPVKVRHFGVNGFRGLEFSFRDGAETRMRAWQFDACPKVAAALAAALTYRCEKGFYMEAGCAGENGGVWGLSFDRKERGAYAVARFHPERAAYDQRRREYVSRCPILLEQDGSGNIAFRHPGTVPDRLIDNFIPAMKRCDVSGGGQTPGTEDAPEGATVRATRPGDINISFPALAERAQAAAWCAGGRDGGNPNRASGFRPSRRPFRRRGACRRHMLDRAPYGRKSGHRQGEQNVPGLR